MASAFCWSPEICGRSVVRYICPAIWAIPPDESALDCVCGVSAAGAWACDELAVHAKQAMARMKVMPRPIRGLSKRMEDTGYNLRGIPFIGLDGIVARAAAYSRSFGLAYFLSFPTNLYPTPETVR